MWPKAGLAVAIVAVGMGIGVALATFVPRNEPAPAAGPSEMAEECGADAETLDVAADEAVVRIVQELADRYTADLHASGRDCIRIEVRPVTASAVVGRLVNGWREDTHGPRPDVWIPQSTLWVELLRAQLDEKSTEMLSEDPTVLARSPTVMAMPLPMAQKLGWPERRLSWDEFFRLADAEDTWDDAGEPGWGQFRLELTDPRYTTTGLQALLALDTATGDGAVEAGTPLSLFRVQRALANIDTSSVETLERYAQADAPLRALSATPLEEREVWRFNETGAPSPGASPGPTETSPEAGDRPELVAMYPEGSNDVAMESDYPYVLLDTSWVSSDVLQFADEFKDYLLSDAGVQMFTDAGFRTRENQPGKVLRNEECMQAMDQVGAEPPGELPKVGAFRKLRSSWLTVPRISRTLFLLDVSGSMQELVPLTGQTRLQATVDAAKESLDIIPNGSEVGLWEFSTELEGGSAGGDYRELAELAPLSRVRDGRSHKDDLTAQLDAIDSEKDTALNDSLLAAYQRLRNNYVAGRRHLIVLLTDGRNDDADSISHERLLSSLARLHRAQEPIQVVSIAYGVQPDLDKLAEVSELVGGRVVSSPELKNLERLFIEALAR
ncbi:MAG TPA: substrate-binding and VWA domain-containing protein [Euzebyales bacterium]|nr:substrate-binding and VWA domain-containing protein [Euzebyales bacterium]